MAQMTLPICNPLLPAYVVNKCRMDTAFSRLVQKLGVGREGHCLGLDGGVDGDPLQIRRAKSAATMSGGQALLDQRCDLVGTHPLAPARHRGAIDRQNMLKERLASEKLEIRVLDPALADQLVGQVVDVLEKMKPHHHPRRNADADVLDGEHREQTREFGHS